MVRTRVAPSPTGFPHIGTIYQALFDYAFAKKHGGSFIVRIEDTDRTRYVPGAEEKIFEALDWFGLTEDESARKGGPYKPYRQSERLDMYKQYGEELVQKGHAYYCFCTKEQLEESRKQMQAEGKNPMYNRRCRSLPADVVAKHLDAGDPHVIRIKIPENTHLTVSDLIRGDITFDSNTITDQVLLKADGYPTYHLAVVVDDHFMKISHLVRGEEWISTSPVHMLLYDYFGWDKPVFFHTPILRNPDKSKLSKRHGHTSVVWYQEQGYLPEAILNFLALMGWSHPQQKEYFDLDEFIREFDLKDVKPVGPIFDMQKLDWINGEYIRNLKESELADRISSFIGPTYDKDFVKNTVPLIRERIKKLSDYLPLTEFFFKRPETYEIELKTHAELLGKIATSLDTMTTWKPETIGTCMQQLAQQEGVKNALFFMVLRVAVTGKKISPPLNESMYMLGKQETGERLRRLV